MNKSDFNNGQPPKVPQKTRLARLRSYLRRKRELLSEQCLKHGGTLLVVGVVASIVSGDTITLSEAGVILTLGSILWIMGVLFSKDKEGQK